jgi:hypothetical protein
LKPFLNSLVENIYYLVVISIEDFDFAGERFMLNTRVIFQCYDLFEAMALPFDTDNYIGSEFYRSLMCILSTDWSQQPFRQVVFFLHLCFFLLYVLLGCELCLALSGATHGRLLNSIGFVLQVVYMAMVGTFPFNAFLSGVLSCVGTSVLGGAFLTLTCQNRALRRLSMLYASSHESSWIQESVYTCS